MALPREAQKIKERIEEKARTDEAFRRRLAEDPIGATREVTDLIPEDLAPASGRQSGTD